MIVLRRASNLRGLLVSTACTICLAASAIAEITYSPDVTVSLAGTIVADEDVAEDDLAGSVGVADLGSLPAAAEVDAFSLDGSDRLFSLDTTSLLPGGLVATPSDVVRYDGAAYSLAFDSLAAGVPDGSNVDAVSVAGSGLHLSFDTTVDLGGGVLAADEDLVFFAGGSFLTSFDGSAAGLDETLDLDAANLQPDGSFVVSFDSAGTIGGVVFNDDTVLIWDGATWAIAVDASEVDGAFAAADLVAVPEPTFALGLVICALALLGCSAHGRRSTPWLAYGGGVAVVVVLSAEAYAAAGVREINQTCAVETGCFVGDAPGFPVTISSAGSYRLTGNLSLVADVTGVEISASYVTLDLGGFEIAGPGSCSGTGAAIDCGPVGTSDGVSALSTARHVTIRNGVVRNMSRDGVGVEGDGQVERVIARHNARHGIGSVESVHALDSAVIENGDDGFDLDEGSIVEGCTAKGNFQHGIEIDDDGGVVYGSVARGNGARGFNIVAGSKFGRNNLSTANGAEDSCGGRFCSERKRFYVGGSFEYGVDSLAGFCDPGFRLISQAELLDGHLARYEGALSASTVAIGTSTNRFELSDGGGFGGILGAFECVDANDILGTESGVRCSNSNVRQLTSGWHRLLEPQATVFTPTICVEE